MSRANRRRSRSRNGVKRGVQSRGKTFSLEGGVERLESRLLLATLYWDPDRIFTNNVIGTGAGLGGSGTWAEGGAAVWFNPALNGGAGGYVSWNSSSGDKAVFTGPVGGTVTISGAVGAVGVEFHGAGYTVSGGDFTVPGSGTAFTATVNARFDTPLAGGGGIIKTGAATLTLGASLHTYTGDTVISAGILDVRGTIRSHVKPNGGSVQGVMFYDPDLATGVREGLGLDVDAWLTPALLAESPPLTALTINGNAVGDLTGLASLAGLTSLELIPGDYAGVPQGISSLAPLAGLTSLALLSLHDVGLTNAVLETLPALPALTTLDVRYNALSSVPASVANRPRLATIFVHGNPLITDDPRAGLASLKGRAVDVDVAPDRPETATSIEDLAARLYFLPLKMLEYVTNTVAFQPYSGAMKGPLATLQTKAGNDWDTNSLLASLYGAAGISTRYVAGVVKVTPQQLMDYVGTRDVAAAAKILQAAGLGDDTNANRLKHTWLEARVTVPASGVQAWVPLDASWKMRDYRPGLPGMLTAVPFNPLEQGYLSDPAWQKRSTAEYYEAKVAAWLAQNRPDLTIADVGYDGPIRQQAFSALPVEPPYDVDWQPPETETDRPSTIPAAARYAVTVTLGQAGVLPPAPLFSTTLNLDAVALSRIVVDPGLNAAGSAVTPALLVDGIATARAAAPVTAATQLTLTVSVTAPAGGTGYSRTFTRAADRMIAIGLDANQFSEPLLAAKRGIANVQQLNQANGVAVDRDQAVGGLLDLAIAQYFAMADADEASLASLTSAVPDRTIVALGIATGGPTLSPTPTSSLQFPYLPADMGIDVPANVNGGFAIDASTTAIDLNRDLLMGYTNSSLEGIVLEELTNFESVSTMKAFQLAAQAAGGIGNLVEINASNVGDIAGLLPGVRAEIRNAIAATVTNGLAGVADYAGVRFTARVPKNEITVGGSTDATKQWQGVGYTLTCVTSDPAKAALNGKTVGYIIHGSVAGGPLLSYGGATSRLQLTPLSYKPSASVWNPDNGAGDPVNVVTGNVYHEETDFELPNLGVPLAFARRYDSIHTVSGLAGAPVSWSDRGMGEGWSFTYADRLEFNVDGANTVTWFTDTGMRLVFTSGAAGYANPAGVFGTLTGTATSGFT